jgi:tetratricopeptide (TPR) repeat protein
LENYFLQALNEDPKFEYAYLALAQALWMQNKVSAAIEAASESLKIRPDSAFGHELLGRLLAANGNVVEARAELLEALRLDPESIESYIRLSEIDGISADRAGAIANLKKAKGLAPHDPSVLAHLSAAYARNGDLNEARAEIKLAELDADVDSYRTIGEAYDLLKDFPGAVRCYEQVLAYADARGIKMAGLEYVRERVQDLKPTLTPHYVKATPPKAFTGEEVMQACRTTLSANEFALVVNPLEGNAEMKRWAQELVGDATNEFDKAHKLFLGMTKHLDYPNSTVAKRTAIQAFNEWNNLRAKFNCQDYSLLTVVLAREVGLNAFFVWVEKDFRGRPVSHACAGIFVDGKALLVDPAFHWFGAAHQGYQFKDDREVIGIYLSQLPSEEAPRIAVKLVPDFALARFNYSMNLAQEGKSKAAEEALDEALKLDSASWFSHFARGVVAGLDVRWHDAEMQFRDALDDNPDYPELHYFFGIALVNVRKYEEAMKELQKYLDEGDLDEKAVKQVREHIKKIIDSHVLPEGK